MLKTAFGCIIHRNNTHNLKEKNCRVPKFIVSYGKIHILLGLGQATTVNNTYYTINQIHIKRCLLLIFFCPLLFFAQEPQLEPKLEHIAWIAGTWHGEALGGQVEEIWSIPSSGSMMATFKLIVEGQVVFYEIEIIRELTDTLILQLKHFRSNLKGWEEKDETVDFPLKSLTANKVEFEGMLIERISPTEMHVSVEVTNDAGQAETLKFEYFRQ